MAFIMASSVATALQMQQGKQKGPRKTNWSDSEITVLTEKVEENLDLIPGGPNFPITSLTQRRTLRGWR